MITPQPSIPTSHSFLHGWVTCRHRWLIEFSGSAVVAAQPWPDPRAWCRRSKGEPWHPIDLVLRVGRDMNGWRVELLDTDEGRRKSIPAQRSVRCRMQESPFVPEHSLTRQADADPVMRNSPREADNDSHGNLESAAWWESHKAANRKSVAKFIQEIPGEVLSAVAAFPDQHWNLLGLASIGEASMKLIETAPALAVALATPWEFREISPAAAHGAIREMLGKRQKEIAEWLGFPVAGRSLECLCSMPPHECAVDYLLRHRSHMVAVVRMHQTPRIDPALLRAPTREGKRIRRLDDFIEELEAVAAGPLNLPPDDDCPIQRDVHRGVRGIITVRSREQQQSLHDPLLEKLNPSDPRIIDRPPLPPPPLGPQCRP